MLKIMNTVLDLKLNSDRLFWFQLNQFSKFAMSGYQLQNENSKPSCKIETKFLISGCFLWFIATEKTD